MMMRSLSEATARWDETVKCCGSVGDLQRAVKFNGAGSPCLAGCRSVCWKVFLLFQDADTAGWAHMLRELRTAYGGVRDRFLRFVKHPEQLAQLSSDPLADDPDSPWDAARRDELVRAEILQDVRRLPDEAFYHEERVQTMILDILFLHCKLNPADGGYRQGMHELLAPIVYVVAHDAVDRAAASPGGDDGSAGSTMLGVLDARFVEHDAYALFARVMDRAKAFYEVGGNGSGSVSGSGTPSVVEQSAIVEKSKHIHEALLVRIDGELASHLRSIEVLPQIFLIRWIRLLFGREFPFEQLLVLWDTMFAFDPNLELIELVCVAMLIRIRWTLLEADYSVALQLLLKYPAPQPPHGPHTFVDDAVYLRDHLNAAGGSALVLKYTGKTPTAAAATSAASATSSAPATPSATSSRPSTPAGLAGFASLRQRALGARSPLSSSARLLQQPGGVEALFQGAANRMIERGERLGFNQAVRDAMGEIRRNVQGFQDARGNSSSSSLRGSRSGGGGGSGRPPAVAAAHDPLLTIALMERRNRQLAAMLDGPISSLKEFAMSQQPPPQPEAGEGLAKHVEAVEIAAAKIQFVKIYLEDSSLSLAEDDLPPIDALAISSPREPRSPPVAPDATSVVTMSSAVEVATSSLSPSSASSSSAVEKPPMEGEASADDGGGDKMVMDANTNANANASTDIDTDMAEHGPLVEESQPSSEHNGIPPPPLAVAETEQQQPSPSPSSPPPSKEGGVVVAPVKHPRPQAPIPTRSSLAQSSFSWMLEPDTTSAMLPSSNTSSPPHSHSSSRATSTAAATAQHGIISSSAARERNAFLFGEVTSDGSSGGDGGARGRFSADEIFGLQPLSRKGGASS